jgi:hypothetical protein
MTGGTCCQNKQLKLYLVGTKGGTCAVGANVLSRSRFKHRGSNLAVACEVAVVCRLIEGGGFSAVVKECKFVTPIKIN